MFYVLSKVFWAVAQPMAAIGLLVLLGIVLGLLRWRRLSLLSSTLALALLALGAWTSTGALLLHPLENRFERPDPAPADVTGIVVLGGGFEGAINLARGGYELNDSGDRFVEAAVLARRYPDARVAISGGHGTLLVEGDTDADTAARMLVALGVERGRLLLENRSRNTQENAEMTRDLVQPKPGETWLLVTSAFHMPRSVGLFRRAGFDVVPWPADYKTTGNEGLGLTDDNYLDSFRNLSIAFREWVGLAVYRLTGRIDEMLPEPR